MVYFFTSLISHRPAEIFFTSLFRPLSFANWGIEFPGKMNLPFFFSLCCSRGGNHLFIRCEQKIRVGDGWYQ
jgi:hypothetical protein